MTIGIFVQALGGLWIAGEGIGSIEHTQHGSIVSCPQVIPLQTRIILLTGVQVRNFGHPGETAVVAKRGVGEGVGDADRAVNVCTVLITLVRCGFLDIETKGIYV